MSAPLAGVAGAALIEQPGRFAKYKVRQPDADRCDVARWTQGRLPCLQKPFPLEGGTVPQMPENRGK